MKTNSLHKTRDYSMFEFHPLNRPLHEDKILEQSMEKHGFMPSSPIQVVRNGNGKMKIIRGHHRFAVAKSLKIPIYYVIDESNTDIFDLEGNGSGQGWTLNDFASARAKGNDKDIIRVKQFASDHKIAIPVAATLLAGRTASVTSQAAKEIKNGTYRTGNTTHAYEVAKIVDLCREIGISFSSSSAFVAALSMTLKAKEVDQKQLCERIKTYPKLMTKRGTRNEYLEELETAYNHHSKRRIPLKHIVLENGRALQKSFGRK